MDERARLRKKQAEAVIPMIGPLLEAWDALPNDVKSDPELERLSRHIEKVDSTMEWTDG